MSSYFAVGYPDIAVGDCGLTSQMPRRYCSQGFIKPGIAGGETCAVTASMLSKSCPFSPVTIAMGQRCCPFVAGCIKGRICRRRFSAPKPCGIGLDGRVFRDGFPIVAFVAGNHGKRGLEYADHLIFVDRIKTQGLLSLVGKKRAVEALLFIPLLDDGLIGKQFPARKDEILVHALFEIAENGRILPCIAGNFIVLDKIGC